MLADDVGRRDLHAADLPRTVGDGAAGLLGQPEDLARERGEPPPAGRQRDAPARTHEEVVAELLAQRADTATETAGSVTSSSAAAAFTDPCRATRTNDCSWASVTPDPPHKQSLNSD